MADRKHAAFRLHRRLTPPVVVGAASLIAALAVTGVFIYAHRIPQNSSALVERRTITDTVAVSGIVKPSKSVDLSFQRSGTIANIAVDVGAQVAPGDVLATLSNADLRAARSLALADLEIQNAKLSSLESGTRPEILATHRAAVAQALQQAYLAADDALHSKVDQFLSNPRTQTPQLTFSVYDGQLVSDMLTARISMEDVVSSLQGALLSGDPSTAGDLVPRALSALDDLAKLQTFLNTTTILLTKAVPSNMVSSSAILGYEASVAAGRTEVSQAFSALNAAEGQLSLDEAGATADDLAAARAAVAAAQASVDSANAELQKSIIYAPIGGTIVRQDGNVGEVVSPGQTFLSLDSASRFQVEAYVSEADIAKMKVGLPVAISLDAYPGASLPASVIAVDPAATMQNGVPSYKVTVQFANADPRVKAGLTANLSIEAATANDVLSVPSSALIMRGSDTYVMRVTSGGAQELVPVATGVIDRGGFAEILSGLSEGDRVASFGSASASF